MDDKGWWKPLLLIYGGLPLLALVILGIEKLIESW